MDGRIGMMKLIAAFRNFANSPKKKLYEKLSYMQSTELVFVASSGNSTV
jgi:hypothetical protein